jgi:ribonuclease HII
MTKKRSERTANLGYEKKFYKQGYKNIIGIDEAGRGPLVGPIAAGAVCLPVKHPQLQKVLRGVKDSKQMTSRQRETAINGIKDIAVVWGVGSASAAEIDDLGIDSATELAMKRAFDAALADTDFTPDCLFLDSILWPEMRHIPQVSLIGGDGRSLSIASASVLAKVWRDTYMIELDKQHPEYGFAQHMGYPTVQHKAALKKYGSLPEHRQYYSSVHQLSDDNQS